MSLTEAFVRTVLQFLLLAVVMIFLVRSERSGNGLTWLYLPFFFGPPGLLVSLIVFAPLEKLFGDRAGGWGLLVVPAAAATVPCLLLGTLALRRRRLPSLKAGSGFVLVVALLWSGLWLATGPLYRALTPGL